MKQRARQLVDTYVAQWDHELEQVWEVERPFELHLGDATVIGRADVILDCSGGEERLTIVDYKTADSEGEQHAFQLQVYADAGRREGLDVERAFVHNLTGDDGKKRLPVDVSSVAVGEAEDLVTQLIGGLRERTFLPLAEKQKCSRCDVGAMCKARAS